MMGLVPHGPISPDPAAPADNDPLIGHVLERMWSVFFGCQRSKDLRGTHCAFKDVQPLPW